MERPHVTRRSFLKGAGGLAAGGALAESVEAAAESAGPKVISGETEITLVINGERRQVVVEPRTTLLSVLRHKLEPALTGTKEVCDEGACGACTVIIDGRAWNACMTLAIEVEGTDIRTVEGLAAGGKMTPVQEAFCEEDAMMCGFCTPGFVMSVTACLEKNPAADDAEVREACSGNLCRCGTYPNVFAAAKKAGERMRGGERR